MVFYPFKGCGRAQWQEGADSTHAKFRGPGERAIAQLKNWDILHRLRHCPQRSGRSSEPCWCFNSKKQDEESPALRPMR